MKNIQDLLQHIQLDKIDKNLYTGTSISIGSPIVFGGQVLAQSLYAMSQEVDASRICHSLHSYFILPGQLDRKIIFEVENVRDGGSFSTRRVLAKQGGEIIFILSASFHSKEDGVSHQMEMPETETYENLLSWADIYEQLKGFLPPKIEKFLSIDRPITFKPTQIDNPADPQNLEPKQSVWFRINGEMQNNPLLNRCLLAYASDYNLLPTATRAHGKDLAEEEIIMASLDHSMWFHRDFDINQWFLYEINSPSTANARGFTQAKIFGENGDLIASVAQEGLLRIKK